MPSIVVEFLLGLYLGLLTGIVPAMVAGGLGFTFKYVTGVTLPGLGVVVLAVAIAGISGGLLGLIDPTIAASPRLMVALVVVMMLSLYAHAQGDALGQRLPRRFSLRELGTRTLSGEVIVNVGGLGRVEVTPIGEVRDLEGYPPLSPDLRATLSAETWTFPADVPIEELERRLEDRLRAAYDLAAVDVEIDARANARISAAPPVGSLSRRVPEGERAVSLSALLPTGIVRGERVRLVLPTWSTAATVLSARATGADAVATDGGEAAEEPPIDTAPQTTGGEGRITVSVPRETARRLLEHDRARVHVLPRGLGLEYELISRLKAAGNRFARHEVGPTADELRVADLEAVAAVRILATRSHDRASAFEPPWTIAPSAATRLEPGDGFIAVGPPAALREVAEAVT